MAGVKSALPGVSYLPSAVIDYYAAQGVLSDETLTDALSDVARRWPDRIALSEPGVTISHGQLDVITDRVAAALHRLGLRPLERVLFQTVNSKELMYAFLGCLKAGLIPVCTLAAHRSLEIGQIGRQAAAVAHIVSANAGSFDLVGFALSIRKQLTAIRHTLVIGDDGATGGPAQSLDALWQAEDAEAARAVVADIRAQIDPYQVAMFQLSGGTSGTPKIIPRFHNEYVYASRAVNTYFGFDETLVAFTPNPLLHNMPMSCFIMPALLAGGEVAIAPGGDLDTIARVINETPSEMVRDHARSCTSPEGARCHRRDDVRRRLRPDLSGAGAQFQRHGPCAGLYHLRHDRRAALLHAPAGLRTGHRHYGRRSVSEYDEIRLVEPDTERDVEPGGVGELLLRGPCAIRGYYEAPEHNAGAFTSDGYYRSGDLMSWRVIDGQRYLAFEGRVKDVIDRGGEKINCSEVELAVNQHPKVAAVMCVAMPDREYGEKMCAFVMLEEGQETLGVAEVAQHLDAMGFAKFKFPERIEIVAGFPIASSGKPSKPMLRDLIVKKLEREQSTADHRVAA